MNERTNQADKKQITVIAGDGIGPEVVGAARRIIEATGVRIAWEECEAGANVFRKGVKSGVPKETIDSLQRTRTALKGPLETPIGYGEKSANVTLRKLFETYGNLRPVRELPGVKTRFSGSGVDLVIVRENVEDLYAGIEHMQTPGVAQCLKLMSKKGCEKIARLAFEVALAEGRTTVHCATKANIMKFTEGLLKRTFEEVARDYPSIKAEHIIIDNCAHQLVRFPESFQVIVTSNMNGDILSDLTSGLIGGLGFAPGANIGREVSIFEAVHGSAPGYAGKDVINPTAVILSSVMMLRHIDEIDAARAIENAVYATLEKGIYTRDVTPEGSVSTTQFTNAIIDNLGNKPTKMVVRDYKKLRLPEVASDIVSVRPARRRTLGVDVFVEAEIGPERLGPHLEAMAEPLPLALKMISNRGTKVYPSMESLTDCVDHYRCRFVLRSPTGELADEDIFSLLARIGTSYRFMHLEKLEEIDGARAYALAQGED